MKEKENDLLSKVEMPMCNSSKWHFVGLIPAERPFQALLAPRLRPLSVTFTGMRSREVLPK